jgi:hypothetical protein
MFMELCAGDQNPNPRGKLEQAEQHGKALAGEVTRPPAAWSTCAERRARPFQIVELGFNAYSREALEKELNPPTSGTRAMPARC